jgi:hypothetical protein
MRSVRTLSVGALLLALTALAACGGGSASSAAATATQASGASSGGEPTDQAQATPTENPGGGGGGGGDVNAVVDKLTPPNSTQISRTDASGAVLVSWESTDSVDSLKSFYEGAIPTTGMKIFSTTNASGSYNWIFAESEGSSHGGSVTVAPSTSGGSGSTVIVSITTE